MQPEDKTIAVGETAMFSVMVIGTLPVYQWQMSDGPGQEYINLTNGIEYSGVNSSALSVNAVDSDDEGVYRVLVSNGVNPAVISISNAVRLLTGEFLYSYTYYHYHPHI